MQFESWSSERKISTTMGRPSFYFQGEGLVHYAKTKLKTGAENIWEEVYIFSTIILHQSR
jgi:hypothetical protein